MCCKYCGKPLPEGTHGKQEYCGHAHRQAYYREKFQQEQQEGIERLKKQVANQNLEIMHLKRQIEDLEEETNQQQAVISHLKQQVNLEQRYLNDTQARGFLSFIRRRPPTPLIQKLLTDRSLSSTGEDVGTTNARSVTPIKVLKKRSWSSKISGKS